MSNIDKYLERYAHERARSSALPAGGPWSHAVVIPVKDEEELLPELFLTLAKAAERASCHPLRILIVNGPPSARNRRVSERYANVSPHLHVVDACSDDKKLLKEGVGGARKLGCDIALALWALGQIEEPWIYTTDADARVPLEYFRALPPCAAYLFDYHHGPCPDRAHELYERYLRYYVAGLSYARSPYAFHSLGSTIVVSFEAYATVRGFPRREAAEDFYLLNKVAKVGRIVTGKEVITLQPRSSDRVPFGTGVGTRKIRENLDHGQVFLMEDPRAFELLRELLAYVAAKASCDAEPLLALMPDKARMILDRLGGVEFIHHTWKQRRQQTDRIRHFHTWFDGFRTLRFLHETRDLFFPDLPSEEAIKSATFLRPNSKIAEVLTATSG